MYYQKTQKGYVVIIGLVVIYVFVLIGVCSYYIYFRNYFVAKRNIESKPSITDIAQKTSVETEDKKSEDASKQVEDVNDKPATQSDLVKSAATVLDGAGVKDAKKISITKAMMEQLPLKEYPLIAALQSIDGKSDFSGVARMMKDKNANYLYVSFTGVPALSDGESYYGWLISDKDGVKPLTTGKVVSTSGKYVDMYVTGTDMSSYMAYVLVHTKDNTKDITAENIALIGDFKKKE